MGLANQRRQPELRRSWKFLYEDLVAKNITSCPCLSPVVVSSLRELPINSVGGE